MSLRWTRKALQDLERLYAFMEPVNPVRAHTIVEVLIKGAERLTELPRIGERLRRYSRREVRRIFVGDYELRYELRDTDVVVLRLWHAREDR
ncbi:MAG: type II toxin-antitoxin system RelE/ParE family toxin [Deltaproteobacteria bacterium]|nr:type II toxin-antitoxin system RelE/ParE family toxin [Deltaproteobacteria bacterium]